MKKIPAKILLIFLLLSSNLPASHAEFKDVFHLHKNYDAIIYLQENDIIQGYPDGTFKPENKINRAEFLKIIMEGTDIPLNIQQNAPFPDIDQNSWYAPYIKKAYKEGWISGYPDGTFQPEQTINKVEALKMLGEIQNWDTAFSITTAPYNDTPVSEWYTNYVAYAKNHNYLEETGSTFAPEELMTRAKICEIIYRTLTITKQIEKTESTETSTTTQKYIPKDFYNNVTLDENIPNTFYKNEVFTISGEIDANSYETITILLDPEDNNDLNYDTFTTKTSNGSFEIPVYFKESGNFNLGILPGNSGETIISKISVLPSIPDNISEQNNTPEKARFLKAEFSNDKTSVNFSTIPQTLKKLTFKQNENRVTYLSRQNTDYITVDYKDFQNFGEGKVTFYIETAKIDSENPLKISSEFTKSDIEEFNSTKHTFSYINNKEISTSPPEIIKNIQPFTFSGKVKTDAKIKSYLIKPDGFVEKVNLSTQTPATTYLNEKIIPENGDFKFEYNPSSEGIYIIEILNKHSLPILNHPVYVGNSIPLIPDFFDLHERKFFSDKFNIDSLRSELLSEINKTRKNYGLSELVMSMELNNLAQSHSEDMAENNFFGHINLQNQSPEDRRLAEGIKTHIGENIAQDVSIPFAHNGLMRSAVHRKNILEEDWTRVGLGIALSEGYLFITEEFAGSEINEEDLENYKDELYSDINSKRTEYGNPRLIYDYILESAGNQLNNYTINEKKELTNSIFQETIESYNITGTSQAIGRVFNIWSDIHSSILNEEETIFKDEWEKIGIDIQTDETGTIYTFLIINNP